MFKHYCGIKRDTALGTNGRMQKQTISVANKCLFVPMSSQLELENSFTVGSGYDVYFPDQDTDVLVGDQLIWNAKTFNVRAVALYDVPSVGHIHCITTREGV